MKVLQLVGTLMAKMEEVSLLMRMLQSQHKECLGNGVAVERVLNN